MLDQILAPFEFFSSDTLILLPLLIGLEAVLSADNAIALAAIAQNLPDGKLQRRALDIGLIVAFTLRVLLILTATWVTKYWQFELAGALYLMWLVVQHFFLTDDSEEAVASRQLKSLWAAIPLIALTDLAFSLDSVTTAIALSKETWLVITGGAIGVITLRFMAELFIRWLEEYTHLEDAGYVAVALVASRLMLRVANDNWVPPEWVMVVLIAIVFVWGFSERVDEAVSQSNLEPNIAPSHDSGELPLNHGEQPVDEDGLANESSQASPAQTSPAQSSPTEALVNEVLIQE